MLDIGLHISFAGNITYKKSDLIREAVKMVPLDRLLLETDSPYLSPLPFRGSDNEPGRVRVIHEATAFLLGISIEELAGRVMGNFFRLFGKSGK